MNIQETLSAFKTLLEPLDVEITDHVPDGLNLPCIVIYPETVTFDVPCSATVVLWCLTGGVEEAGAQARLNEWLGDNDGSIVALIDADNDLGGTVDSVRPIEVRQWGVGNPQEGRPRAWQAELVCEVIT